MIHAGRFDAQDIGGIPIPDPDPRDPGRVFGFILDFPRCE
jgi:hypothetical protein